MVYYGNELDKTMPDVVGSITAQVSTHSNTIRQGMNPWLLPDCTESGSIGAQNVQHLEIRWRFNGELSPGGNVRLVKSCEWLSQPVQDYKPIPLPLPFDPQKASFLDYHVAPKASFLGIPSLKDCIKSFRESIFPAYFLAPQLNDHI